MIKYQLPDLKNFILMIPSDENQHFLDHLSYYLPEKVKSMEFSCHKYF